jgi:hypothetical protein
MNRGAATATSPAAAEAAREVLDAWGSSADAVVAAFFALAGQRASGLFAPLTMLVAGPGAGARVFDGRALQPGKGLARPRGFTHGEAVPDAAHAAVPRSIGALALAQRQRGRQAFARLADRGVALARDAGEELRAKTIATAAREGPSFAIRDPHRSALLAAAGPLARGVLTGEDLDDARAGERPATDDKVEGATLVLPAALGDASMLGAESPTSVGGAGGFEAIAAVDAQGVATCLVAWLDDSGVLVPELGVSLPACGVPVRRGVPRVRPGEPRDLAMPMAIVERGADLRIAVAGARADACRIDDLIALASEPILEGAFSRLLARGGVIAVVAERTGGRVVIGASQ